MSNTVDLRDVLIVAHPAGTTLIDMTWRNQLGGEIATKEALKRLEKIGAEGVAEVSMARIPAAVLAAMQDGSVLWVDP